jgi:hypothetical protein
MIDTSESRRDFFVSFNKADRDWATWIAWVLEEAGYRVFFQDWDFKGNFVLEMDRAHTQSRRTIAILSQDYLTSRFTAPEWAARFAQDATSEHDLLIPVQVRPCTLQGLLAQVIYIDLLGCSEVTARDMLLKRVEGIRLKPNEPPLFPGRASHEAVPERPTFPTVVRTDGRAAMEQLKPATSRSHAQYAPKHEFRFQAFGKMEHVISLLLEVKGIADERQATLIGDLRAGGFRPIDPGKQYLHIGLRKVRISLSYDGCSPGLGPGIGDDNISRSSIESSIRVSRPGSNLWEIATGAEEPCLIGYLIKNAPLTPLIMYECGEALIEATLRAYPGEIELQDLSKHPGSHNTNDIKMKLLKLALRKVIGRDGDEIILMQYRLIRQKLGDFND